MDEYYEHKEEETTKDVKLEDIENKVQSVPYITEELISSILARLPAKVIHRSMKLVCKHWSNIIRSPIFIETHLSHSKTGLFIRDRGSQCNEIEGDDIKDTDFRFRFPGKLIGGSDGVLLISNSKNPASFSLANPITMQVTILPNLEVPLNPLYDSTYILRVPSIRKFKVVHLYEDQEGVFHWFVLTVGIDKVWRNIDVQQSFERHILVGMNWFAVPAGEMVYWPELDFQVGGTRYFVAMNMADETTQNIPTPFELIDPCGYMKMGNHLSCYTRIGSGKFQVFVLKNTQRGEWVKEYDIDLLIGLRESWGLTLVLPVSWLKNKNILILEAITSQKNVYLGYNVKKKETNTLNLSNCCRHFHALVHTDSLISW